MFNVWFWFGPRNTLALSLQPLVERIPDPASANTAQRLLLQLAAHRISRHHTSLRVRLAGAGVLALIYLLVQGYLPWAAGISAVLASLIGAVLLWLCGYRRGAQWVALASLIMLAALSLVGLHVSHLI